MAEWKPEDDGLSPDFRLTNFTGLKGAFKKKSIICFNIDI